MVVRGNNIFQTVVDEGASTCIMSMSCWKAIGFLELVSSSTMLKAFNGHTFNPYGILTMFPIKSGSETVSFEIEVVNAPLEYNLLLGHSWFYVMKDIVLLVFPVLRFLHQGKMVTIDQLDYYMFDL